MLSRRKLAVIWLVILLVDLLSLLAITVLRYDDGLRAAFVSDSAWFADYRQFAARFTQSDSDVVVLFRSGDFSARQDLRQVGEFVLEARLLNGVADVISVFALRSPPNAEGTDTALLPIDVPSGIDVKSILDRIAGKALLGPSLISADRSLTAVIVALDKEARNLSAARVTLNDIETLARNAVEGRGLSFAMTGVPTMRRDITDGLYDDLVILNLFGIIAGFLICVLALRSVPLAMLSTMPSGTALFWALGALGAFGYPINVVSIALPVLILVLSFTDSLHLTFEIKRLQASGDPPDQIVLTALRRIGPACALASLTTAIAFGGLTLSDSAIISDLGISGIIAAVVSLTAVLIVHPLLFVTYARFNSLTALYAGNRGTPPPVFDLRFLPTIALRRPAAVGSAAAIVLVAAGAIYSTIEPAYSVQENIRSNSVAARTLDEVSSKLGPIATIDLTLKLDANASQGIEARALTTIDAVHRIAETIPGDGPVLSLTSLLPPNPSDTLESRAAKLSALLKRMPDNLRGRFVSADGGAALVRIYARDQGSSANRDAVAQLEAALRVEKFDTALLGRPSGFLVMSSFVSAEMITDLNYCFLFAVIASGLLTVLWFKNLGYGLVALVPNILPIVLVGAWLALSGRGLQFSSGVALTIAFGIAVDDTVHILNRLKLNAPPGAPFDPAAIRLSLMEVTPVLVVTTAVLSFGLTGTFISSIPTVTYFGVLSIVAFLLAILADLIVLPACLSLLYRAGTIRQPAGAP